VRPPKGARQAAERPAARLRFGSIVTTACDAIWHESGTEGAGCTAKRGQATELTSADLALTDGAGDGNRTRIASLEDCARRVVRGPDLRPGGVTGLRY
jgi:hypothetical protein